MAGQPVIPIFKSPKLLVAKTGDYALDSDIGVSHVSDELKLLCKTTGQASFCISVDTSVDEDIVFDSQKWPIGVRIRPFNERTVKAQKQSALENRRKIRSNLNLMYNPRFAVQL